MARSGKVGLSYKQHRPEGRFDAIVIGSGIGGLASAALLARHGNKRVLVLERHSTAGGFTHTFTRPGWEWDVGVHYIGQCEPGSPVRALFDEISEGTLRWARMPDVYDRVILGDDAYDVVPGFVGEPVCQIEAPSTSASAKSNEEDLLAQFLLKSL